MSYQVNTSCRALLRILISLASILAVFSMGGTENADGHENLTKANAVPNIVWIMAEDVSVDYFDLYDKHGASTPNISKLASSGITFNHAFSNSPVCSVARTTLITGVYAPRLATQFHRKTELAKMPADWNMFPCYLREAGYFTTNRRKKDYNAVEPAGVWDKAGGKANWTKRAADQPFFHVQTFTTTHEGSTHFKLAPGELEDSPWSTQEVGLPPYFPDTPLFRYTKARYLDRVRKLDKQVGNIVDELKAANELENTFIFFFGDHGGVLPRSKGYLFETGLHVPLVVRVPKNFKHLVNKKPGTKDDQFVQFVDLGPTVLKLAGLKTPSFMDGHPVIGDQNQSAEASANEAFGYADRFDEKYDMIRSLRIGKYKYIRNFRAIYPDGLTNNYRYKNLAYQEWRTLFNNGELSPAQSSFFEPKQCEYLFDIESDPHEVKDLSDDPSFATKLKELRIRMSKRLKSLPDLSFYPESHLVDAACKNPIEFGSSHRDEISELVQLSNLSLLPFEQVEAKLRTALKSENRWHRYWACSVCSTFGQNAASLAGPVTPLLEDEEPTVRIRAFEFLRLIEKIDSFEFMETFLQESHSPVANLIALQTLAFFKEKIGSDFDFDTDCLKTMPSRNADVERRVAYFLESAK